MASAAIAALAGSATGVTAVLAAVSAPGDVGAASYIQGGGSAAAVAGLVYVARLIAKGELVPRPVKDNENELNAAIMVSAQREAKVMQLAEQQQTDHKECRERHDATLLALAETRHALADVASEMRYWREMRDRGTRREDRDPYDPKQRDVR